MSDVAESLFDAHLHPSGMEDVDLETLRYFGVEAAVLPAHHSDRPATPAHLRSHFDELLRKQLPRVEKAGIRAWGALGVHPQAIPRRGLSDVLATLPGYFEKGRVVAIGEIGLHEGGPVEEEAFVLQLALAKRLKVPVLVHTPVKDKERVTRRALTLLRASGVAAERVLVDHANGKTVRPILECGYFAGLTLHPDELTAERAVALIRTVGTERIVLNTDAGDGASDMLGLARVVSRLRRAGLSDRVIRRVARDNASVFYGVDL